MIIEGHTLKQEWEREWSVNLDSGRVQHLTGLTVEVRRNEANQWHAQARNAGFWSCEDPGRRTMLPTLLLQAEAVFLKAFYIREGMPRVTEPGIFFPEGWEKHWTIDIPLHSARHKLTLIHFQFDCRKPDGTWVATAPDLAQWLALNSRRSTMFPVLQVQAHKLFNATLSAYVEQAAPVLETYPPTVESGLTA